MTAMQAYWTRLTADFIAWMRRRGYWLVGYASLAGIVSFVGNVYLIAIAGGYNKLMIEGALTPATYQQGAAFWFSLNLLVFASIGYGRTAGAWRLLSAVVRLPQDMVELFCERPLRDLSLLLFGFALVFPWLPYMAPWTTGIIAADLLVLCFSSLPIYGSAYLTKALWLVRRGFRGNATVFRLSGSSLRACLLGAAAAHLFAFASGMNLPAYGYAIAAILFAVICWRKNYSLGTRFIFFIVIGVLIVLGVIGEDLAFADDGGFSEYGGLRNWWDSDGGHHVRDISLPAAPIGGGGALIGGLIGETGGGDASNGDDEDLTERLDRELFGEPKPDKVEKDPTSDGTGHNGKRTINLKLGEDGPGGDGH